MHRSGHLRHQPLDTYKQFENIYQHELQSGVIFHGELQFKTIFYNAKVCECELTQNEKTCNFK